MSKSKNKKKLPRNTVASAMRKRYAHTSTVHSDKRLRRKNRQSWRDEIDPEEK